MKPVIELKNVGLTLNQYEILKDISLEILPGEIISLIGLNGSGKSSLLKTMLGIYQPTSGKVINRAKKTGYVPQKFEFDRSIPVSGFELLEIYSKKPASEINKKLKEVSAYSLRNKKIGSLSGGEMQRLLIANALLNKPDLLLLDEPTSGLDITGEKDFYCLIEDIHKQYKMAIVIVSHDIHLVFNRAKKVFCVDHCLACHGHPKDVQKTEAFKKLFGPHLIPFEHHKHHDSNHC